MTQFTTVYDAFLSKILDDEWEDWEDEVTEEDLFTLLEGAVVRFKFPRTPLTYTLEGFDNDLSNIEIQILATYMKVEWLNRTILTWENVKPLYEERDFSQANLIDKFNAMLAGEQKHAAKLESIYYRSIEDKPYRYRNLGTKIQ